MPLISDPASELHVMCTLIGGFSTGNTSHRGAKALAKLLGVPENSSQYFMGLGAIAGRFDRLATLFSDTLSEPHKGLALQTLSSLQVFLNAEQQMASWEGVRGQVFTDANMRTLLMSGLAVRQVAPISIPTPDERKEILSMLDEALQELSDHHGAISSSIHQALEVTRRMLAQLEIFGTDSLSEHLLRLFALKQASAEAQRPGSKEKSAWAKAWATVAILAGTLVLADESIVAVENHYHRANAIIRHFAAEQKQLPAPNTHLANDRVIKPEEEERAET